VTGSIEPENYARKCSEIEVKNSEENFPPTTLGYHLIQNVETAMKVCAETQQEKESHANIGFRIKLS